MEPILIRQIVEAALLASPQPLTLAQLAALFPEDEPAPPGSLEQAIAELRDDDTRGVELVEVASGFRFQVKAGVHSWVARLWTERQAKYTRATLETLALIAYRQPITRGEIEAIRGVAVNANTIKMLEEREWIRSVGHRDVPGRPELFGTTRAFLDYFGLKSLDELPPLAELKDIPELEPQLPFDNAPVVANAAMALDDETTAANDDAIASSGVANDDADAVADVDADDDASGFDADAGDLGDVEGDADAGGGDMDDETADDEDTSSSVAHASTEDTSRSNDGRGDDVAPEHER